MTTLFTFNAGTIRPTPFAASNENVETRPTFFVVVTPPSDPSYEWALRFQQSVSHARERLHRWRDDPDSLRDDDLEPPTSRARAVAEQVLNGLAGWAMDRVPPPDGPLLDLRGIGVAADGTISIELTSDRHAMSFEVAPDGAVSQSMMSWINERWSVIDRRILGAPR